MNDIVALKAKCDELQWSLETCQQEKAKLGVLYEELLEEKAELEKKIEFLSGQVEAYKYVVDNIRR